MKLADCTIGKLVVSKDGIVGHIVGLTVNGHADMIAEMPAEEQQKYIIPMVRHWNGNIAIHHAHLEEFTAW